MVGRGPWSVVRGPTASHGAFLISSLLARFPREQHLARKIIAVAGSPVGPSTMDHGHAQLQPGTLSGSRRWGPPAAWLA